MAEEEDDSGSKKVRFEEDWCSLVSTGEPDPKNGRAGVGTLLQRAADAAVSKYINIVVNSVLGNIQDKHLPSVKLLMDVAGHLESKNPTPADFESFARLLMKEFLKEQGKRKEPKKVEEQEARMTIPGEQRSLIVEPCGE